MEAVPNAGTTEAGGGTVFLEISEVEAESNEGEEKVAMRKRGVGERKDTKRPRKKTKMYIL